MDPKTAEKLASYEVRILELGTLVPDAALTKDVRAAYDAEMVRLQHMVLLIHRRCGMADPIDPTVPPAKNELICVIRAFNFDAMNKWHPDRCQYSRIVGSKVGRQPMVVDRESVTDEMIRNDEALELNGVWYMAHPYWAHKVRYIYPIVFQLADGQWVEMPAGSIRKMTPADIMEKNEKRRLKPTPE